MTPQHSARHFTPPSGPDPNRPLPAEEARRMEDKQCPLRVLVVEDDFLIAMQTEVALTTAGFEVVGPATTAEEAVALAGEAQPTLAVMDIRLASTRDGIDAARQLYQEFAIRCIFATAHEMRTRADAPSPMPRSDGCRSRTPWRRSSPWLPKLSRYCAGRSGGGAPRYAQS